MQGWSRDNFDNVHGFYLCYLSSACPGSHVPLYRVTLGADINYSALLMPPPLMYSMMWNCLWNFEELQLRNCLLLVRIKYRYPNMWLIRKESNFLSSGHSPKLSKQSFEGNLCFWISASCIAFDRFERKKKQDWRGFHASRLRKIFFVWHKSCNGTYF